MRTLIVSSLLCVLAASAAAQQLQTQSFPDSPFRNELRLNEDPANPGALNNRGNTNRNTGRTTANFGEVFIAAYVSEENAGVSEATEIYVNISRDNGRTWSLPTQVSPTDGKSTRWPKVLVGPDPLNPGSLIFCVVAEDNRTSANTTQYDDVRAFWSTDGVVWTESVYLKNGPVPSPNALNPNPNIVGFDVDEMRAVMSNTGVVHVVAEEQGRQPGCVSGGNESLWYARSADGGRTFEPYVWLDSFVLGATCQANDVDSPLIAADGDFVVVAWADNQQVLSGATVATDDDLWVASSTDGGLTFNISVAETNGQGGEAGDVDGNAIAVQAFNDPVSGLQFRAAIIFEDSEPAASQLLPNADSLVLITTIDGGLTWSPEVDVDPSVTTTANAGVEYLNVSINGDILSIGYCADQFSTTINGSTPSFGNNDDFREAFFVVSSDFGATLSAPVDLDVIAGGNRANNELFMKTDGLTVITQYQVNPFGGNDDAWNWSADNGISFSGSQIVFSSFLGDVDRGGSQDNWLSVNFNDLSAVSIYGINTIGQNEDYIIGLKFPYVTSDFNLNFGTTETLGLGGAFLPSGGESFLIAVGASGNTPVTNLGNGLLLPIVPDFLTFSIVADPFLLLFTAGAINAGSVIDGGSAIPFPVPAGLTLNYAGLRLGALGNIVSTTDGVSVSY